MKIILTESQFNNVKKSLNEGVSNTYSDKVKIDPLYFSSETKYKGHEIDDISADEITLSYNIEIEGRSWGIKNIYVYGIEGPQTINLLVKYYKDGGDYDWVEEEVTLPLSWESLVTDEITGEGMVTIGHELELELKNDQNGNLVITKMTLPVYTL